MSRYSLLLSREVNKPTLPILDLLTVNHLKRCDISNYDFFNICKNFNLVYVNNVCIGFDEEITNNVKMYFNLKNLNIGKNWLGNITLNNHCLLDAYYVKIINEYDLKFIYKNVDNLYNFPINNIICGTDENDLFKLMRHLRKEYNIPIHSYRKESGF